MRTSTDSAGVATTPSSIPRSVLEGVQEYIGQMVICCVFTDDFPKAQPAMPACQIPELAIIKGKESGSEQ